MPPRGAAGDPGPAGAHHHTCGDPEPSVPIALHGERRNVTLRLHDVIPQGAGPRALDLVEIAAVTLMTDIGVRRGENEAWVRDLSIRAPVRDPAFWEQRAGALERIVHFLTGDNVSLTFAPREPVESAAAQCPAPEVDGGCLLPGGVDSSGGAAALLKANRRPALVSHSAGNPSVDEAQRHVAASLGRTFDCTPTRLEVFLAPSRVQNPAAPFPAEEEREPSQRSRAFVFLAAAVAAADAVGVEEVYAFENGVLACHLPPTRARVGSLSTRSN
ncbi:MAG: hypothetical protein ACE5JM_10965, partial [Armatimonadota bacterium]